MRRVRRIATVVAVCICSLMVGISGEASAAACPPGYRYKYVSLDTPPPEFDFVDYFKVTDRRDLYANAYACDEVSCVTSIVRQRAGVTTVVYPGAIGYTANETGTVGGSILTDPDAFIEQAALFVGGTQQLIPRLPGEVTSHVRKVTNSGVALVESWNGTTTSYYLYFNGRVTPLNLGSGQVDFVDVIDPAGRPGGPGGGGPRRGVNGVLISGTQFSAPGVGRARAFRFVAPSGPLQLLDPLPTEPDSWGQAINSHGDVLGYSFVPGHLERIGYWHNQTFHTWFVEGTPEFPTVSNHLLWNESGLIVITDTTDNNSYLVPKPGVRLNLADLTTGLPPWTSIVDVNNNGDLLGVGGSARYYIDHAYLLERTCAAS